MGWQLLFAIIATVIAIMITKPIQSFKSMAGLDPTRSLSQSAAAPGRRNRGRCGRGQPASSARRRRRGADSFRPRASPASATRCSRSSRPCRRCPRRQAVPATAYASAGAIGWAGAERMAGTAPGRRWRAPAHARRTRVRSSPNALPPDDRRGVPPEDPRPRAAGHRSCRSSRASTSGGRWSPSRQHSPADGRADTGRLGPGPGRQRHRAGHGGASRQRLTGRRPPGRHRLGRGHLAGSTPSIRRRRCGPSSRRRSYPTGIVVQSEPGVYRSGGQLKVDEYVRFPEPQVDANGEETWTPLYRAKAKAR